MVGFAPGVLKRTYCSIARRVNAWSVTRAQWGGTHRHACLVCTHARLYGMHYSQKRLRAVPSDIGTLVAATEFRKRFNADASRVDMFVTLRGGGVQGGACSHSFVRT
jgi:hypothetical protein